MRVNEGVIDRIVRIVFGAAVLSLAFFGPRTPYAYIGLVPLITGLVGYCPLYALMGVNSCKRRLS